VTNTTQVIFPNWVAVGPSDLLKLGTKYTVLIDSGAFVDFQGNAWEGISSDTVWSFTTKMPVEVADLAALRASDADNSTIYTVTGEIVLTGQMSYRGRKYLQDPSAGIEIDDDALKAVTSTYSIGDGITGLTGTLENYFGWLEIHPIMDPGTPTSTGNAITPKMVTIADLNANFLDHAAELIRIDTADLAKTGNFANGDEIDLSRDAESTVLLVNFYDTDLTGSEVPAKANVTGIAYWHYSTAKITPRFLADVEKVENAVNIETLNANSMIKLYPNPSTGTVTLELSRDDASDLEVEIYSLSGKMVYRNAYSSVTNVQEKIDLSNVARGMYVLRVRSENEIFVSKLVIK